MNQHLILDIESVHLLKTKGGIDELTLWVRCPEVINKVTEGSLDKDTVGTDIFGDRLDFVVKITHGCGEKLAEELGLKVDKIIEL